MTGGPVTGGPVGGGPVGGGPLIGGPVATPAAPPAVSPAPEVAVVPPVQSPSGSGSAPTAGQAGSIVSDILDDDDDSDTVDLTQQAVREQEQRRIMLLIAQRLGYRGPAERLESSLQAAMGFDVAAAVDSLVNLRAVAQTLERRNPGDPQIRAIRAQEERLEQQINARFIVDRLQFARQGNRAFDINRDGRIDDADLTLIQARQRQKKP
ncbi:MAG TPA: hypothetical protein VEH84_11820 [Alphaproteobacteria bacterium]|nr:hypothetical protein [Alphaproteobacteria bacterium]